MEAGVQSRAGEDAGWGADRYSIRPAINAPAEARLQAAAV
jgi:hypothetical protein